MGKRLLLQFLIYAGLLVGLYFSTLTWLVIKDWNREAYSYCYLIPFIVLYLVWRKRDVLAGLVSAPSWKGLVPMALGLSFFWLGELSGEYLTLYASFWLVLAGICWTHLGWSKFKVLAFPFVFMLTMFPLPHFLVTRITLKLQLISSKLGVDMITLAGLPAYREGNIIDLGFTQLQVVEACSGLHSVISLSVLGLLLVYFYRTHFWKRALLLLSVLPLAVFANSGRIAVTAVLYKFWGAEVAEGFFHGFSGLAIFLFCLPVLLIEMWLLDKLPPSTALPADVRTEPPARDDRDEAQRRVSTASAPRGFFQPLFLVNVFLLAATLGLYQGIEFREKIPIKKSLDEFPVVVGEWVGTRNKIEQMFIDTLDLSEYADIDYQNPIGKRVNLYVAYYESQTKGESIHSPATCLPGTGWTFEQSGAVTFTVPGRTNGVFEVDRALMQKGEDKQVAYYWFDQRGRILTSAYELKLFVFWDSLTKQRSDGALVRLVTTVYEDEDVSAAEARLQAFAQDIVPLLREYIPGKDVGE